MKTNDMFDMKAIESKRFDMCNSDDSKVFKALEKTLWVSEIEFWVMINPVTKIRRFTFS